MGLGDPVPSTGLTAEGERLSAVIERAGGALRAWSLAVSFLGDCIVPRGGEVGMAAITEVLGAVGIDGGVIRTSMSRLASDGWVTRQKVGRNSFYALTPAALAQSEAATRRIYAARHPDSPCAWKIVFAGGLPKPEQIRIGAALRRRGAADLGVHVYLLPDGEDFPAVGQAIAMRSAPLPDAEARTLVERAFDLAALGANYAAFLARFQPVRESLTEGRKLTGVEAVAMRVLVIHVFRRIALRDPMIPAPYLPDGWPGIAAREAAAAIWRALYRASEAWLDAHAASAYGPLPPRSSPWQRF
jgi:phenylacetic acid degradation operon negative regulatory protein